MTQQFDPPVASKSEVRLKRNPRTAIEKGLSWVQDPAKVRRDLLAAAHAEFVEKGLSGARVDEIAARTATSKRMIYYYFKDKIGLYRAVLEQAYGEIRALERQLDLDNLAPSEALAQLVALTFDFHADRPDFVRLVMVENIHHAKHLAQIDGFGARNFSALETIEAIYARGVAQGVFRAGLTPLELHLTISALSFYNVSNRATIKQLFRHDMAEQGNQLRRRQLVIDAVTRFVAV
ncbi:AcrR Transcriptional regulator [Rhabdaerophilaceae bacterium]